MDISVGSGGGAGSSGPLQFIKNSSTVTVTQDTTTPANNIPLPVQLYGTSGTINITAGDINVQLSDQGANPDVTRIGDGTTQLGITVSNEAKVADSNARVSLASIDTKTPALGQALAASSVPVVLTAAQLTTLTPLSSVTVTQATAANLNATVVGTGTFATQVTSLPSLPTGANTIGAISNTSFAATQATAANLNATVVQGAAGASAWKVDGSAVTQPISAAALPLPTGAATETTLAAINTKTPALGQAVMASSQPVVIASNQSAVPVSGTVSTNAVQRSKVNLARNDYSGTPVTTAAYVQLIASTSAQATLLEIFDSSGQTLVLAVGAAASEIDQFYINPGGNGQVQLLIPAGSRVSIKAVTASATAGYINLNLYS